MIMQFWPHGSPRIIIPCDVKILQNSKVVTPAKQYYTVTTILAHSMNGCLLLSADAIIRMTSSCGICRSEPDACLPSFFTSRSQDQQVINIIVTVAK